MCAVGIGRVCRTISTTIEGGLPGDLFRFKADLMGDAGRGFQKGFTGCKVSGVSNL
jgi:hypothetical protein